MVRSHPGEKAVIVSSGRGVHEALAAALELEASGIHAGVVDMPSLDEQCLLDLYDSGKLIVVAEQNNGFIWPRLEEVLFRSRKAIGAERPSPSTAWAATVGPSSYTRQPTANS